MQTQDLRSILPNPFNHNLFLSSIQLLSILFTDMVEQPEAWAAYDLTKGNCHKVTSGRNQAFKKCTINRADCSLSTSVILSQESQHVIIPPSIIVMAPSIGSLWQTLKNRTWLGDRLHRLIRPAAWNLHHTPCHVLCSMIPAPRVPV